MEDNEKSIENPAEPIIEPIVQEIAPITGETKLAWEAHRHTGIDAPKVSFNNLTNADIGARVYLSTSDQTIATSSATKVAFNAENWDALNEFDSTTNYRYAAKTIGKYLVTANITYAISVDQKYYAAYIYKNGVEHSFNRALSSGTGTITASINDIISLIPGDYIEIYTAHNSGSDNTITAGSTYTYLSIHKIGN